MNSYVFVKMELDGASREPFWMAFSVAKQIVLEFY